MLLVAHTHARSCSHAHTLPRAQVLHRPAPQVRPVYLQLHESCPGPGPVRCRTQTPRPSFLRLRTHALTARSPLVCAASAPTRSPEMRAGAGENRSRSKRPGTAWCRSSSHSTRRWCTPSALRAASTATTATTAAAAAAAPLLMADSAFPLSPGFFAFALLLARLGRTRRGSAARRLGSQLGWCVCACWVWALAHCVGVVG